MVLFHHFVPISITACININGMIDASCGLEMGKSQVFIAAGANTVSIEYFDVVKWWERH